MTGSTSDESSMVFDDNIETYFDETGRVRVSRLRAMGFRMTRDLQRNLDLMKEVEQEKTSANEMESVINGSKSAVPRTSSCKWNVVTISPDSAAESVKVNERNEDFTLISGPSIEISFDDDGDSRCLDGDDDIFASLVGGNPIKINSDGNAPSRLLRSTSDSDCEWEEGAIGGKDSNISNDVNLNIKPLSGEGNISDDGEVEWEEGICEVNKSTSCCLAKSQPEISKGLVEEEADLQEAIKRSLEDLGDKKSNYALGENEKLKISGGNAYEDNGFLDQENKKDEPISPGKIDTQQSKSTCEIVDGVTKLDDLGGISISQTINSAGKLLKSSVPCIPNDGRILIGTPHEGCLGSSEPVEYASEKISLSKETPHAESVVPLTTKEFKVVAEQHLGACNEGGGLSMFSNMNAKNNSHTSDISTGKITDVTRIVDQKTGCEAETTHHLVELSNPAVPFVGIMTDELILDIDTEQKLTARKSDESFFQGSDDNLLKSTIEDNVNVQFEDLEANLEEEMHVLSEERMNLGDEQRKFERNAESVSSEMFTECQVCLNSKFHL